MQKCLIQRISLAGFYIAAIIENTYASKTGVVNHKASIILKDSE
jgi:hypothetical protein